MKTNKIFAVMATVAIAATALFTSCQADDFVNDGGKKAPIYEGFRIEETWSPKGEGTNTINTTIILDGYCVVNGEISKERSSQDKVDVRASVAYNPNHIIFVTGNQLPQAKFDFGKDQTWNEEISNTDKCTIGDFTITNEYNRKRATVYDCSGKDSSKVVGFVPKADFNTQLGAFLKDTVIAGKKYNLYAVNTVVTDNSSYKREYDAVFNCSCRAAFPDGTIIINHDSWENISFTDACNGFFNWTVKFWDSKNPSEVITRSTKFTYVREVKIINMPANFVRENGDILVNISVETLGGPEFVSNGSNDSISWEVSKQSYRATSTNLTFDFYVNYTSKLNWKKGNADAIAPVPAPTAAEAFANVASQTSKETGYTLRNVGITASSKFGDCTTSDSKSTVMKEKDQPEDVITWILRNVRVQGTGTASNLPWAYDRVKLVNGVETETTVVPANAPYSWSTSDVTLTVTSWPTLSQQAAVKSGFTFTTKTNVTTRNFVVVCNPVTVNDNVAGKSITFTPTADMFSFQDMGVSTLTDIAAAGGYDRKQYTSTAQLTVAGFSSNKIATITLQKLSAKDYSSIAGPTPCWDYNNNYHVCFAIVREDEGVVELYIDPQGDNAVPSSVTNISDMRDFSNIGDITAFQTKTGEWIPAEEIHANEYYRYYSLRKDLYVAGKANTGMEEKKAHNKWGGNRWENSASIVKNANGTYTGTGWMKLLSVDDNVKQTVDVNFTTAR